MFDKKRVIATVVYLSLLVATLVVAIKVQSIPLVLVMLFLQFCALIWCVHDQRFYIFRSYAAPSDALCASERPFRRAGTLRATSRLLAMRSRNAFVDGQEETE